MYLRAPGFDKTISYPSRLGVAAGEPKSSTSSTSSTSSNSSTIREKWNIFMASDSPAAKVPGARASRYRDYGIIGFYI